MLATLPNSRSNFCAVRGPDAGHLAESGFGLALASAEAVKSYGETVGFVSNLLNQVQNRGVAVQFAGLVFLTVDVENFFFFGDAGEGLIDDL